MRDGAFRRRTCPDAAASARIASRHSRSDLDEMRRTHSARRTIPRQRRANRRGAVGHPSFWRPLRRGGESFDFIRNTPLFARSRTPAISGVRVKRLLVESKSGRAMPRRATPRHAELFRADLLDEETPEFRTVIAEAMRPGEVIEVDYLGGVDHG